MLHEFIIALLILKVHGQWSKMHDHSPTREGSEPWEVTLPSISTQRKNTQLQSCCSEEGGIQMAIQQGSIYTLVEPDLWSDMLM